MTDALSTAQSAFNAMAVSMAATANNVANLDTDGYKAERVNLATAADGDGVRVAGVTVDDSPGSPRPETGAIQDSATISDQARSLAETSNVDPVREMVNMIEISRGFEANVAVVLTQEDMAGTILDLRV